MALLTSMAFIMGRQNVIPMGIWRFSLCFPYLSFLSLFIYFWRRVGEGRIGSLFFFSCSFFIYFNMPCTSVHVWLVLQRARQAD